MAKISLHKATREQLVEGAGLRPLVAEAILKVRDERGGEIADISALKDTVERGEGDRPGVPRPAGQRPQGQPPGDKACGREAC